MVHSKEMRLNLCLALLLPRLGRLHCRKKEEVGIIRVNINKALQPRETSGAFNMLFQKTIPDLVKTRDSYCTANSSGQESHAQGREAMSGPVAAARLQPPKPSQEAEHFVLTSLCFFCCWPFPPSDPQRTSANSLAPLYLSSSHTYLPLPNHLLFKPPSFPPQ